MTFLFLINNLKKLLILIDYFHITPQAAPFFFIAHLTWIIGFYITDAIQQSRRSAHPSQFAQPIHNAQDSTFYRTARWCNIQIPCVFSCAGFDCQNLNALLDLMIISCHQLFIHSFSSALSWSGLWWSRDNPGNAWVKAGEFSLDGTPVPHRAPHNQLTYLHVFGQ